MQTVVSVSFWSCWGAVSVFRFTEVKPGEPKSNLQTSILVAVVAVVARSLRKIPGSNHTVARIFHFVILARLAFLSALGGPCK